MASFDDLLKSIHGSSVKIEDESQDTANILTINAKRQFVPGEAFDSVIAYEGDINSQIVTIECVRYVDKHDLSACGIHELRWKNLSSGAEGKSKLGKPENGVKETSFLLTWEVPSEACTQEGNIEISVTIYDVVEEEAGGVKREHVVFSWNTASYSELTVGKSMNSVGAILPARDEILIIDRDTKNITAPAGYNNVICYYGEKGMSEVYFLIDRYIGKNREVDVYDDSTNLSLYILMKGNEGGEGYAVDLQNCTKRLYTQKITDRENEGMVLITWQVPDGVTCGAYGPGKLEVAIEFTATVNGKPIRWISGTYKGLTVEESVIAIGISGEGSSAWLSTDEVTAIIQTYFKSIDEFYIDANEE